MDRELIATERLLVMPFNQRHLTTAYVSWLNDPEVVRFSELRHRKHTIESCTEYYNAFIHAKNFFWAILTKEDNKHIGNITAHIDYPNSVADVGILLGCKDVWGNGYGLEVWRAVCTYLLNQCAIRKVTAGTLAPNQAMVKIMEQSGMIKDGHRLKQCVVEGKQVDMVHYCIFSTINGS